MISVDAHVLRGWWCEAFGQPIWRDANWLLVSSRADRLHRVTGTRWTVRPDVRAEADHEFVAGQ